MTLRAVSVDIIALLLGGVRAHFLAMVSGRKDEHPPRRDRPEYLVEIDAARSAECTRLIEALNPRRDGPRNRGSTTCV